MCFLSIGNNISMNIFKPSKVKIMVINISACFFLIVTCFWDRCLEACAYLQAACSELRAQGVQLGRTGLKKWYLSRIPLIHPALLWLDAPCTQTSCKWQPRLITQTLPGTQACFFYEGVNCC